MITRLPFFLNRSKKLALTNPASNTVRAWFDTGFAPRVASPEDSFEMGGFMRLAFPAGGGAGVDGSNVSPLCAFYFSSISSNRYQVGCGSSRAFITNAVATDEYRNYKLIKGDGFYVNDARVINTSATTWNQEANGAGANIYVGMVNSYVTQYNNPQFIHSFYIKLNGAMLADYVVAPKGSTKYSATPAPMNCFYDKVTQTYILPSEDVFEVVEI